MREGCLAEYMVGGVSYDMGIINTFFKKKNNQYITYKWETKQAK
jgi:hypothetical protein